MGDVFRAVTFSAGGRPVEVLRLDDIDQGTQNYIRVRDSFKFNPGVSSQQVSESGRRYGGGRIVGEIHSNGNITWQALVKATTKDQAALKIEDLLSVVDDASVGRYIEWRPDGLSAQLSSFFQVQGPATWDPGYQWTMWEGSTAMPITITIPTAPLAEWPRTYVGDDFSVDSEADYTFDSSTAADVAVSGGVLTPTGAANTQERRLRHTARGYQLLTGCATVKATPGTTITSYKTGVILRASGPNDYVECYVDDNGTNSRLRIDEVVGGSRTNRGSANLAARVSSGVNFWVRGRIEAETVLAEFYDAVTFPTPSITPTTSISYAPTAGQLGVTAAGYAGISWIPQSSNATIDDYQFIPWSYRAASLPDTLDLPGVPGEAPAKAQVSLTNSTSTIPVWAMLAWAVKPQPFNMTQASFDLQVSDWLVGAVTGVHGAGSSITQVSATTATQKFGAQMGQIVTPATADTGAHTILNRRFRKGYRYKAELWLKSATGVTTAQIKLGVNGDIATSTAVALSTTWTKHTVTWAPAATVELAHLTAVVTAATATTFEIDGGMVYEGIVAPTRETDVEGFGVFPTFGLIRGSDATTISGWSLVSVSNATGSGIALNDAAVSGVEAYSAEWEIDPSLMSPALFTGEVVFEVWGRIRSSSAVTTPTVALSIKPRGSVGVGAKRYTNEYGSVGKTLTFSSGSLLWRSFQLGTMSVPLSADGKNSPMRLRLDAATGAGSTGEFGLDYLWLVPAGARALSPTGKDKDDTSYPSWITFNSAVDTKGITKTVFSDLSGNIRASRFQTLANPYPDHGLGGSLIELAPGDNWLFVKLSDEVPDDPLHATGETGAITNAVDVSVIPRSRMLRSG